MFKNVEEMVRYISDENIEQIDFKCTDMMGRWRHITLSARGINAKILTEGNGISLSPYPGYRQVHQGDMVARPDVTTAFLDPFTKHKTLSVICDFFYPNGKPYERNPRNIARHAEEQIKKAGIDGISMWLPEMEFYILDGARYGSTVNSAYYELFSETGSWNHGEPGYPSIRSRLPDAGQGQIDMPRDRHGDLRAEMVHRIEDAGYEVKYQHHELGGAGQCEIEPRFASLLKAADSVMVMKYMIANTAREQGMTATFMPKPMVGAPGNGMHFHQYLMKDGKSLFYSKDGYAHLNEMGHHYIGGLCRHTPALMGLGCASSHSYRRFGVGLAAPMNLFFSESNRSSAVRIPAYDESPEGERVEYRLPDATANPYLIIAAQLLAGLDGIKNKIHPTPEGFGPFDVNNYELSDEERGKIKSAPTSLEESLCALGDDREFLTDNDVFPNEVIDTWVNLKMQELDELDRHPHPYEFELYFDL